MSVAVTKLIISKQHPSTIQHLPPFQRGSTKLLQNSFTWTHCQIWYKVPYHSKTWKGEKLYILSFGKWKSSITFAWAECYHRNMTSTRVIFQNPPLTLLCLMIDQVFTSQVRLSNTWVSLFFHHFIFHFDWWINDRRRNELAFVYNHHSRIIHVKKIYANNLLQRRTHRNAGTECVR